MIDSTFSPKAHASDRPSELLRFLRELFAATPLFIFVSAIRDALR